MARSVGRNDPCPCGSGRKYKKCCQHREQRGCASGPRGLASHLRQRQHTAELDRTRAAKQLAASCDPLHGLTPDQLHRLLAGPFTSPELISFPDPLEVEPAAPVVTLFNMLVERLGDKGVTATATGNLPRQLCRDAARAYWGDFVYEQRTQIKGIYQETDFFEMHVVRVLAGFAGLVRKRKGRFILSQDCRRRLSGAGAAAVYPRLFLAGADQFNWAYLDPDGDLPHIQSACFFTLYLLSRYGGEWLSNVFFEDCFLRLFPMEIHEVPHSEYFGPEDRIRSAYTWRSMKGFAERMGLAEMKPYVEEESVRAHFEIRKTPLLNHVVHFHLLG